MYHSQYPWVELYNKLLGYYGADAYGDLLECWIDRNSHECFWLEEFRNRTNENWGMATDEDLCHLYAIFRVTSILLLRFQVGRADGTDYPGPSITVEGWQLFHEELGFCVPNATIYHPFFHEIVAVNQSPNPVEPISIERYNWPCLMLGDMIFCRAGCAVSGGIECVNKEIATSSKLYWTYRRKDRLCDDLSHGWGHNSQWATQLRRDYRSNNAYHFNVDGDRSLNDATEIEDDVSIATMVEIVCNRCTIASQVDDADFHPYNFRYTEKF